jgi:aminoglycoside phosphotransferase (APT) family kinase protein
MLPRSDDPTYTPELVASMLAAQCPQLSSSLGLSVVSLGRGWDCDVFALAQKYVVRIARNGYAASALAREHAILRRIAARLPLPIPRPCYFGSVPESTFCFVVYEYLPGITMLDAPVSPQQRARMARPLGQFLRALHAIDHCSIDGLPDDELGRIDPTQRGVNTRPLLRALREQGALTRDETAYLLGALDAAESLPLPAQRALVHGDLHHGNLLVREGEIAGVIDWVDCHRGHPAVDLALAYLQLPGGEPREQFFESYGGASPALRSWAQWRAITWFARAVRGAREREDHAMVADCVQALAQMSRP